VLISSTNGAYYTGIDQTDPGGTSFYNALLLKVEKRLSNHYTILTNYTYAHCLSSVDFTGELAGNAYQNPAWRDGETSNCDADRRHVFNLSLVATSGGLSGNAYLKYLTKNWSVSPLVTLETGLPFTITDGTDVSLTGEGSDRPNIAPGVAPYPTVKTTNAWFNSGLQGTPAFVVGSCGAGNYTAPASNPYCEPLGTFGDMTRNKLYGPGTIQWDMALSRTFELAKDENTRWKLDVRADFFNIMNHANWNSPSAAISSSTFGQVTGFGSPRQIQMALKLHF